MINKELPAGAEFKYRNQKYIVTQTTKAFTCDECKEANAQYIKRNRSKCIAVSERSKRKNSIVVEYVIRSVIQNV